MPYPIRTMFKPVAHAAVLIFSVTATLMGSIRAETPRAVKPNIVIILVDDMGFSDIGAYGSEIQTPNLDNLAYNGLRFTQFTNAAKCFPSRASLLTGKYADEVGMGSEPGALLSVETLPQALKSLGYQTYMVGKHHGTDNPVNLGFDRYRGLRDGASNHFNPGIARPGEPEPAKKRSFRTFCFDGDCTETFTPTDKEFYSTDTYTDWAIEYVNDATHSSTPFFLYVAYQAPHDPLQAWPEDIRKYDSTYDDGYESIRAQRAVRLRELGLIDDSFPIATATYRDWESLSPEQKKDQARRMEVYAAMIDRVDQNILRLVEALRRNAALDNTLILFMSDNGSSAEHPLLVKGEGLRTLDFDDNSPADRDVKEYGEEIGEQFPIGSPARWTSLGEDWANVSNYPFRYFKNYSYAGGVVTPLIVYWPDGKLEKGKIIDDMGHFIDLMPTLIDIAGGEPRRNLPGISLVPLLHNQNIERETPIFWRWKEGKAIQDGDWKLVTKGETNPNGETVWHLYDMRIDRTETNDLAELHPDVVRKLSTRWQRWADSIHEK